MSESQYSLEGRLRDTREAIRIRASGFLSGSCQINEPEKNPQCVYFRDA